jgi:hypothetical protein
MPHSPYYGTIDATPLFVCLFVEWGALAGDQRYDELLPNALAALACDTYGDPDGDGFVEYTSGPDTPCTTRAEGLGLLLSLPDGSAASCRRPGRGPGVRLSGDTGWPTWPGDGR